MLACGGIVLHGGASESWIGNEESYHTTNTFLKGLVSRAEASLGKGTLAVDVAEEVVAELEDYPAFNAGKGAAVNVDGNFEVQLDFLQCLLYPWLTSMTTWILGRSRHC